MTDPAALPIYLLAASLARDPRAGADDRAPRCVDLWAEIPVPRNEIGDIEITSIGRSTGDRLIDVDDGVADALVLAWPNENDLGAGLTALVDDAARVTTPDGLFLLRLRDQARSSPLFAGRGTSADALSIARELRRRFPHVHVLAQTPTLAIALHRPAADASAIVPTTRIGAADPERPTHYLVIASRTFRRVDPLAVGCALSTIEAPVASQLDELATSNHLARRDLAVAQAEARAARSEAQDVVARLEIERQELEDAHRAEVIRLRTDAEQAHTRALRRVQDRSIETEQSRDAAVAKLEEQRFEVERLGRRLALLEADLGAAAQARATAEQDLDQQRAERRKADELAREARTKQEAAHRELAVVEARAESLARDVDSLRARLVARERRLEELDERLEALRSDHERATETDARAGRRVERLEQELTEARAELSRAREAHDKATAESFEQRDALVRTAEAGALARAEEAERAYAELVAEAEDARRRSDDAEALAVASSRRIEEVEGALRDLETELRATRGNRDELRVQLEAIRGESARSDDRRHAERAREMSLREAQRLGYEEQLDALKARIEESELSAGDAERSARAAERLAARYDAELGELRARLGNEESERQGLRSSRREMQHDLDAALAQLAEATRRIDEVEDSSRIRADAAEEAARVEAERAVEAERRAAREAADRERLEDELLRLRAEMAERERDRRTVETRLESLTQTAREQEAVRDDASSKLRETTERLTEAEAKLREATDRSAALQREIDESQRRATDAQATLQEELVEYRAEIDQWKARYDRKESESQSRVRDLTDRTNASELGRRAETDKATQWEKRFVELEARLVRTRGALAEAVRFGRRARRLASVTSQLLTAAQQLALLPRGSRRPSRLPPRQSTPPPAPSPLRHSTPPAEPSPMRQSNPPPAPSSASMRSPTLPPTDSSANPTVVPPPDE